MGDIVDLGDRERHGRGGRAAHHHRARRQRHGLVRPQRRDPAGRQQEPGLRRRRRGPAAGPSTPTSRQAAEIAARVAAEVAADPEIAEQLIEQPEVVGIERSAGGRDLPRPGPHQPRPAVRRAAGPDHRAGRGLRPRRLAAPADVPDPPAACRRRRREVGVTVSVAPELLRRRRRRPRLPQDRRPLLRRGPGRPGAAPAVPGGGPRAGRGAAADVPGAVLGRPAHLLRPARPPAPADAALPFRIGPGERDAWLRCMRIAVDEADLDPAHRDQLWEYLEYAAASMVNSPV